MHDLLFSEYRIGNTAIKNRFVSQAMESNDGDAGGRVSERGVARYRKLAQGQWGIVVVEALSVDPTSLARVNQMILKRENLDGFKRLVEEFKAIAPDSKILFQVTHSGRKAYAGCSQPTALYDPAEGEKLLSESDIENIRKALVEGALLAEEAGADGVDFKMCHGYFGCEMLRPGNVRDDRWGGSFDNRTRFLRESVEDIRGGLKKSDFIMGSRLSLYEGIRGGCGTEAPNEILEDLTEMSEVIRLMDRLGMSYVNVSAGIPGTTSEITRPTPPSRYLYLHQMRYARLAKQLAGRMAVIGSAYSILKEEALDMAEENISKGYTDFAGWGRQSFADPLMPEKVRTGEKVNYCTGCSGCSKLMVSQENDGCILYNPYYKEVMKEMRKSRK